MHDEIYMLWLSSLVTRISARKLNLLLDRFDTAKRVFTSSTKEIEKAAGLTSQAVSFLSVKQNLSCIEDLLKTMESCGTAYFSRRHERFPALLREIPDPPVGIFCVGTLPSDNTHKVAIIGSRKCSEYGLTAARMIAKPLAEAGIVIVSGMARGVDSMAHRGALEGGGKTIAVLGCGTDICYPAENVHLRDEIAKNGCVVSEYPPGTKPQAGYFPARNRIISGLSEGLIVAEARRRSGTFITVEQATEQGREVMAIPGNIFSKLSEGTNQLIREGASPVSDYTDVLSALKIPHEPEMKENESKIKNLLAPEEKQVYDNLAFEPKSFDELLDVTGFEPGRLHFLCTALEIKRAVKKLPGSRYIKN